MTKLPAHQNHDHADVADRARLLLASQSAPSLRRILIDVRQGRATLRGILQTYHQRQLAVALVRRVAGVIEVIDELAVATPHSETHFAASA